jgi:hypothetical protein
MYKIWRFPYSHFSGCTLDVPDYDLKDETILAEKLYTDEILDEISEAGFNAVWVHGILRHIVRADPFPELGMNSLFHLESLRRLTERAGKHELKVFIHMQPPRAVPVSFKDFWKNHPDVGGQEDMQEIFSDNWANARKIPVRSLCTSTIPVKRWIANAMAKLVEEVPLLGGVTVITASEFHSHCYSRRVRENAQKWSKLIECPRCRQRIPEEVAAEIISLMCKGAHLISPTFEIIAWNWSWEWHPDSYTKVIEHLPEDAILMADFERGGIKDIPRKGHLYDEYSLAYAGPSQRFTASCEATKKRGMRVMAKLQIGTTYELASVVSLPLLGNLYDKAAFVRDNNLAGFMGYWNFGNMLSANTSGFNYFLGEACPSDKVSTLEKFALEYFPGCKKRLARIAWESFADAMEYFPFSIAFLYHGVHSHTLAYNEMYVPAPLTGKIAGHSWQPDERGDEISNSFMLDHTEFTCSDIVERMGKLAKLWQTGVAVLKDALANVQSKTAQNEIGNAIICGAIWQSTANTYKIYQLRQDWDASRHASFFQIVDDELDILAMLLPYVERDTRQGYHAEPHFYMFNADKIRAKIEALIKLKNHYKNISDKNNNRKV